MLEKLREIEGKYQEITDRLSQPDATDDQNAWQAMIKEHSALSQIVDKFNEYKGVLEKLERAEEDRKLFSEEPELLELTLGEIDSLQEKKEKIEHELRIMLVPRDPDDDRNVVLEIRAGAGGDEAALFAACLMRMYHYYAECKAWSFEVMSTSMNDLGGLKEGVFLISGSLAYKRLKFESGVHRVQRIPVTESGGRIHTSTVTVAVLPEAGDVDVKIDQNDLKIDTYRSSGAGGQHVNKTESAIRITHIPTGIVVACQDERSQYKNRDKAMKVLQTRLFELTKQQMDADYAKTRKDQVGTGDRSERIRTYNYPQGRVTDHRIGLTIYKIEQFLDGDLDEMLDELMLAAQTGKMTGKED